MYCKRNLHNEIRYLNDTARGIYYLKYTKNNLTIYNKAFEVVWSKSFVHCIERIILRIGNFSTVRETIEVIFKDYVLIYSTNGSYLYDSRLLVNKQFANYFEEFDCPVIYSDDVESGYFKILLELETEVKQFELFDTRGMCVYMGSEKLLAFETCILENELFQIKTRDDVKIINCTISKIESKPVTYLVGDSTVANHKLPFWGWGQLIQEKSQKVAINYAICARSLKSFELEGRFEILKGNIRSGDTLLVGFGHNDQKDNYFGLDISQFLHALSELIRYCELNLIEIKICTPIARRNFVNGKLVDTHGQYAEVIRTHFEQYLIDLNKYSNFLIEEYGVEKSKQLFVHSELIKVYDNTHTSYLGANKFATYVTSQIN